MSDWVRGWLGDTHTLRRRHDTTMGWEHKGKDGRLEARSSQLEALPGPLAASCTIWQGPLVDESALGPSLPDICATRPRNWLRSDGPCRLQGTSHCAHASGREGNLERWRHHAPIGKPERLQTLRNARPTSDRTRYIQRKHHLWLLHRLGVITAVNHGLLRVVPQNRR
jgi:hypothetical protein